MASLLSRRAVCSAALLKKLLRDGAMSTQCEAWRRAHCVMPGLDPGIHPSLQEPFRRGWIAGSSPAMTKDAGLSRIPRHQAAVDRDDRPGQERRRGQAQAQRHVRDLFGIAVAAERGPAPGIDRLVLVADARRHSGCDRAGADAVHGDAVTAEFDRSERVSPTTPAFAAE